MEKARNLTSSANSMQLEETSTMDSLIRTKILKSKLIFWLWNRLESSSLLLSNASISPLICLQENESNHSANEWWNFQVPFTFQHQPQKKKIIVTLLKKASTLSRSWPKGGITFQLSRVWTIPSNFKNNATALLNDSSFFEGKPSNLASTCNLIS